MTSQSILVTVWTTALFAVIVLSLALKSKHMTTIVSIAAVVTAVGGLIVYGFSYAEEEPSTALAVIKSTFAVCHIFTGGNAYSDVQNAEFLGSEFMQIIFWLLHVFGLFATLGAAMNTFGSKLIQKFRIWANWNHPLVLIYGINSDTVTFTRELAKDRVSIVLVDNMPDASCVQALEDTSCIIRSDLEAISASKSFLRSIGANHKRRTMRLLALDTDQTKNLQYASSVVSSLESIKKHAHLEQLAILNEDKTIAACFQGKADRLAVLDGAQLPARVLTRTYPPYATIDFDENGVAQSDFTCVIVGFGRIGQSVLRQLTISSQFVGSQFQAAIFDPNFTQISGSFRFRYPAFLDHYQIEFYEQDCRSWDFFSYLDKNRDSLKYIVICTGDAESDSEIELLIRQYALAKGMDPVIAVCNRHQVSRNMGPGQMEHHNVFVSEFLDSQHLDLFARSINEFYGMDPNLANQAWDYYDPRSSRTFADAIPAFLDAAHTSLEEVRAGDWEPEGALLWNLAHMEHLRWTACMIANGFRPMDPTTLADRINEYLHRQESSHYPLSWITRDMEAKLHACICPWEELYMLDEKLSKVTGRLISFAEADIQIVRQIPIICQWPKYYRRSETKRKTSTRS